MSRPGRPCIVAAWQRHEGELRGFLRHRLNDDAGADDLLQEVFLRAIAHDAAFCTLSQPRAWLFQVARHLLIDRYRSHHPGEPLPESLVAPEAEESEAVADLSACLPRVLSELSADDRQILQLADLEGLTGVACAERLGITLAAVKSRLLRARQRLRAQLTEACQVRFDEAGKVCCHTPRPPLSSKKSD